MSDKSADESDWIAVPFGPITHILPEDEWEEHYPNDCRCRPRVDPDKKTLVIHNSFDGREAFERKKLS
jgi:hypothetical protein